MKEIAVTDSFMGLEKDTRKCQNIETYDDCKTRHYIEHLRQKCGCLPLSLRLSEKVRETKNIHKTYSKISYSLIHIKHIQVALCMTKKEIDCSQTISTVNSTSCMRLYSCFIRIVALEAF